MYVNDIGMNPTALPSFLMARWTVCKSQGFKAESCMIRTH